MAADMPLRYMVSSQQPGDKCRFLESSGDKFSFDFSMGYPMGQLEVESLRIISLLYNNSGPDGYYRIIMANNLADIETYLAGATFTPHYDSGLMRLWDSDLCGNKLLTNSIHIVKAGIPYTYGRVIIIDPSPRRPFNNPQGYSTVDYFDVGNFIADYGYSGGDGIGSNTESVDVKLGSPIHGLSDNAKSVISLGNSRFSRRKPTTKNESFSLRFIGSAGVKEYRELFSDIPERLGTTSSVLYVPDVNDVEHLGQRSIYGNLSSLDDVSELQSNHIEAVIKIEQMI